MRVTNETAQLGTRHRRPLALKTPGQSARARALAGVSEFRPFAGGTADLG